MSYDIPHLELHFGGAYRGAALLLFLSALFYPPLARAQTAVPSPIQSQISAPQQAPAGPVLRLQDLEEIALKNNPTFAQAEAAVRAAEGRRVQAGLYPNPTLGYSGEQLSFRAPGEKSEHGFFVEQEIVLGGKLAKSRAVFTQEKVQAETAATAQRQRILNAVRILYYEALGAQQLVEVRTELARLARRAVGVSEELFNVGQADRPDVLQGEVEAQRIELDLIMAENERDQVWQQLGVVVGNPLLKPTPLEGNLERGLPVLNQEQMLATILRESPEVKRAQVGIERARASIERARAGRIPDLFVRGGVAYNLERFEAPAALAGQRVGPEARIEAGVRIPIFNRNQGNIQTANAELEIAERESQRVELFVRARLASVFRTYQNALRLTNQYQQHVLPRAERAYNLYLANFRQMSASYPQVLIAQRTLFQVRAEYVRALVDVWQNAVQIQGYLLNGGLEAPAGIGIESRGERTEMTTGSQGSRNLEGRNQREQ